MFDFSISGIQKAQKANLTHIRDLRNGRSIDKAVQWGASVAHRAAIPATPWDTTALRNSHRIDFRGRQHRAYIHIDQSAVNPRGQKPSKYGPYLHRQGLKRGRKGGIRAFYLSVWKKYGKPIAQGMARIWKRNFRQ